MLAPAVRHRQRMARESEAGETLIEMLITVILMGVGATAILSSLLTSSATAHLNKQKTEMSVYLQRWAETTIAPQLNSAGTVIWRDCEIIPGPPALTNHPGWSTSIEIEHLVTPVTDWNNPTFTPAPASCPTPGDPALQQQLLRVTLTVETAPGRNQVVDSLVVYKRNPTCPKYDATVTGSFENADLGPC